MWKTKSTYCGRLIRQRKIERKNDKVKAVENNNKSVLIHVKRKAKSKISLYVETLY